MIELNRDSPVNAVLAVAMAWADFYTRNYRAPGSTYFHEPDSKK
jgi:hypothetical protein